jgi:hypothetical protein
MAPDMGARLPVPKAEAELPIMVPPVEMVRLVARETIVPRHDAHCAQSNCFRYWCL